MNTARAFGFTSTLLASGNVLAAGGQTPSGYTNTAEVYNPGANTWTATANTMTTARDSPTATLLGNGNVLVAAGYNGVLLASAEVYNPTTNLWSAVASMNTARYLANATLLGNGDVLVAGGDGAGGYLASAELYNPTTNSWSFTANNMSVGRYYAQMTNLPNGNVLVMGGYTPSGTTTSADIYNPTTNLWSAATPINTARAEFTPNLMSNGLVLAAGGNSTSGFTNSAEVYNPGANTWTNAPSMSVVRLDAAAVSLGSNEVLVTGGYNGTTVASTEVYNSTSNSWSAAPTMNVDRYFHTANVLTNGQVLVVGGYGQPSGNYRASAEVLATAPIITSAASTTFTVGDAGSFTVTANGFPQPTFSATGLPAWASLNSSTGVLSGTPPNTTGSPFTITITASNGVNPNAMQTFTLTVDPAILLSPATVPTGTVGAAYGPATISASGGSGSGYTYAVTSGGLPSGMTISNAGVLSGTPTSPGNFTFVVTATDSIGATGSQAYDLDVKTNTTVALATSGSPSVAGQPVTFTATVNPSGAGIGTPTGTVSFFDGGSLLGSTGVSSSVATFVTSGLAVASHNITAVYNGDANYNTSPVSNTVVQTVNKAATTVTLVGSGSPNVSGQMVTFTATVNITAPGGGNPSGTVTFKDGGTTVAVVGVSGGVAVFNTSTLSVASHPITATYSGDVNFSASPASNTVTQVVNQAATTVALVGSGSPTVYGQNVTFTATVNITAPGGGTPAGTVTFSDGGTAITTVGVSGGVAVFSTSALAVASHPITATYNGSAAYSASPASNTVTQVVSKAATTVALVGTGSPTVYGQSVSFTATVSVTAPGAGNPTGTILFKDGGVTVATVGISGGVAVFTTSTLAVASHPITATYSGDVNFSASPASNTVTQVVNQAATTIALVGSGSPTVSGQAVTFTATVSITAPGAGNPTGTVAFKDGGVTIATVAVSGGVAVFTTSTLSVASHPITAVYSGDTNFSASPASNTVTQVVNQAATTVALVGSGSPTVFGQNVTFTATVNVTAPGGGLPTGTVTFSDGATAIGTVGVAGGLATFTTGALTVASHNITAVYNGSAAYSASPASNIVTQVVTQAATTVALVGSGSPTVFGQNVTFTATINVTAPGAGNPSGTVTFKDGAATIATVAVVGGSATFMTSVLTVASHNITATYGGDTNFSASPASNTVTQVVTQDGTTVSLVSSGSPTVFGQPISFTISVAAAAPGSGTPTGTVTLNDNATPLVTLNLAGGLATFTTTTLTVGAHNMTATYNGDTNFSAGAISGIVAQQVNAASTTTGILTSTNPSTSGQAVTFTASVNVLSPGAGTPTGTVTFLDGGTPIGSGTLSGGIASFTISTLSVGSHTITASYAGSMNFSASTSPALTETVNAASVTPTPPAPPTPGGGGSGGPPAVTQGIIATGADAGGAPVVLVYDAATKQVKFTLMPFAANFLGGVRVAVGDVNGDGTPDIICAAGPGGGPQVRVYDGKTGQALPGLLGSFFAITPNTFTGGLFVAAGDVNGDGKADIIVSADAGGIQVNVFSGKDGSMLKSFIPTEFNGFLGGLRVAAGDVNGDGLADIILGAGAGGGPQVSVYNGKDLSVLASFYAYPSSFVGGVYVAAGDVNGDGKADIIVGAGAGGGPQVLLYDGATRAQLASFYAFAPTFTGGVRVAAEDLTGTKRASILTAAGPSGGPQIGAFDAGTLLSLVDFFAYAPTFTGGVFVGG